MWRRRLCNNGGCAVRGDRPLPTRMAVKAKIICVEGPGDEDVGWAVRGDHLLPMRIVVK